MKHPWSSRALIGAAMLLMVALASPAQAGGWDDEAPPAPTDSEPEPTQVPEEQSSDLYVEQVDRAQTPKQSCTVYAHGAGMGSYCVDSSAGGLAQSLRERFGMDEFQTCRYRDVPAALKDLTPPASDNPDHKLWLRMCQEGIDWDTVTGGENRRLTLDIVWVDEDTDVSDRNNAVTNYLWDAFESSTQLPVPYLAVKPIQVPVVGQKVFFTFRWLDPATQKVVAQGPYSDRSQNGGPYRRVKLDNGMTMVARAKKVTVDPLQSDMKPVTCDAAGVYKPDARNRGLCSVVFAHSSADAEEKATGDIPARIDDAYFPRVTVKWDIKYGMGSPDTRLGNGFQMVQHQPLRVRESQGLNQPPPTGIY